MSLNTAQNIIETDGKFFRSGSDRLWLRAVTYGPFPSDPTPDLQRDFALIKSARFNAIRVFTLPEKPFLDAALSQGLLVFAGLNWRQHEDFIARPNLFSSARIKLISWLHKHSTHKALAGIYVGNEIPSDLVRWMNPIKVREALETLIETGRKAAPHLLFAYANYPSTEYLEPANADFSAFNIYLEDRDSLASYLGRLQNIAGDRPLIVSEFGMDSLRNSQETQAETIGWALETTYAEETAGITIFSWSDLWENNGTEVRDWNFGLTGRDGTLKPAYSTCEAFIPRDFDSPQNKFSIIVCTRNSEGRISACLNAIGSMVGGPFETIVVDDGSTDSTARIVSRQFPTLRLISIPPSGLSAARNIGAENATGEILAFTDDDCEPDREWIIRLERAFHDLSVAAAGGPNLPPSARNPIEAVILSTPGAPSHVLLGDKRAEHLPGCNIAVRREAFKKIGGFDPSFRTAGDDVDFCWRLHDEGFELAFVPGAFVWHWRRPSILAFFKQQIGYGKAERLLIEKHPDRFSKNGEARWDGFVYGGGPVRVEEDSVIYHGPMGQAVYQSITNRILPLRPVESHFQSPYTNFLFSTVSILQPAFRRWFRNHRISLPKFSNKTSDSKDSPEELAVPCGNETDRDAILAHFISNQWQAAGKSDAWDLRKNETRLLIAMERLDYEHQNILIRIWGDVRMVRETLESLATAP